MNDPAPKSAAPALLRVEYETQALRHEFIDTLDAFILALQRDTVEAVLGRDLLRQVLAQERAVRGRLDTKFKLLVIGEFKRGKSMLINALLGCEAVTSDVTPETVTINLLSYGPELRLTACLADGGRVRLAPEDLRRQRLDAILKDLPGKLDHLDIQVPCEMLRGLDIVDTPGLGDLFKQFDDAVRLYLCEADALIYVTSSWAPLAESEQAFLRACVLPQAFPQILFTVNMIDALPAADDAARLLSHVRAKVTRIFPKAPVFGISSLDEFCRLTGKPRPNSARPDSLTQGFSGLREHLDRAILLNRELIALTRATQLARKMADGLASKVALLQRAVEADQTQLAAALSECERQNSALDETFARDRRMLEDRVAALAEEAVAWMSAFLDRIEREVVPGLAQITHEDLRRHFHFFLADSIRRALNEILAAHAATLTEITEVTGRDLANRMNAILPQSSEALEIAHTTFTRSTWTALDVVEFADMMLGFGLGGLLNVAQFVGENAEAAHRAAEFIERLRAGMPSLRKRIEEKLRGLYAALTTNMLRQVEESHREDLAANAGAVRQAAELHGQGSARVAEATTLFARIENEIAAARRFLDQFETRLWREESVAAKAA